MNEFEQYQPVIKAKPEFTKVQYIFSLISLLMGFFFSRFIIASGLGISVTVFTVLFLAFCICYFKLGKSEFKIHRSLLIIIMVFSCNFFIIDNTFIKFLDLLFIASMSAYFIYCSSGSREQKKIGDMLFFDFIKSIIIMPFYSLFITPSAIVNGTKKTSMAKKVLLSFFAILAAMPLTGIILGLLLSADNSFNKLFNYLFSDIFSNVFFNLFLAVVGIPVAFYFFGMLYSNEKKVLKDELNDEKSKELMNSIKVVPGFVFISAVVPIIIIYLLFFASQLAYFTSAFQNILPDGFIPSEYARTGFFQICVVAIINGIMIAVMGLMTKRKDSILSAASKVFISILSLLTIMFIATALSKMVLYINYFGLTLLRVYVTWFMVLLAAVFVIAFIKQIYKSMNAVKVFSVVFVIMFFALSFSNVRQACIR